jgi:hypothetical protein
MVDDKIVVLFKFRPSSHSEDYTLIATYQTVEEAGKAQAALDKLLKDMEEHPESYDTDWSPNEAQVSASGNQVTFEVYSAGYLDDAESVLNNAANPEKMECYTNYQELTITVKLPKGLTPQTAMLVLDKEEAEAIKWFTEKIGDPKIAEGEDGEQTYEWFYSGDEIYWDGCLNIEFEFQVDEKENWAVEG